MSIIKQELGTEFDVARFSVGLGARTYMLPASPDLVANLDYDMDIHALVFTMILRMASCPRLYKRASI